MKIGKLYKSKDSCWVIFASVEDAKIRGPIASWVTDKRIATNTILIFLEEEKDFFKKCSYVRTLTSNGEVGWIIISEWNKTRFSYLGE